MQGRGVEQTHFQHSIASGWSGGASGNKRVWTITHSLARSLSRSLFLTSLSMVTNRLTCSMYRMPKNQWTKVDRMGEAVRKASRRATDDPTRGREQKSIHQPQRKGKKPSSTRRREVTLNTRRPCLGEGENAGRGKGKGGWGGGEGEGQVTLRPWVAPDK